MLDSSGVEVVHREYAGADHGFYGSGPVERVERLLTEITTFFGTRLGEDGVTP